MCQIEYTSWPDHGVPESFDEFLLLRNEIRRLSETFDGSLGAVLDLTSPPTINSEEAGDVHPSKGSQLAAPNVSSASTASIDSSTPLVPSNPAGTCCTRDCRTLLAGDV